ncbi:MAG TPA: hypothetical protein VKU41_20605 [Polyangiaceae bacterium]|nr:hypothetical protein [Polyangiaceae bacterium]
MPSRWVAVPLVGLVPYVWRAGVALAWAGTRDGPLARFLGPAVGLALWLLVIHAVGLVSSSFYTGLFVGTLLVAAGGWQAGRRRPRRPLSGRRDPWMWLAAAGAIALLVLPEIRYSKHDECLITGHLSVPAEMQNGIYPPRHLSFATYELKYHYGVDLLGAVGSTLFGRADVHATVHVVALLLWGYSFCLWWLVGERLVGGRLAGPVTATCVTFAGGAPFLCRPVPSASITYYTSFCKEGGIWITPPFVSNFLQHPWSLGVPLFAALLLVSARFEGRELRPATWVLVSVLTEFLSLAQVVLFSSFVPCFVVAYASTRRAHWASRLSRGVAWAVVMGVGARCLHGFFAPAQEPSAGGIALHPFWDDATPDEWARWHVAGLGALLPLGAAGLWVLRRQRWLLGPMAGGGLLVRDAFVHRASWNIVKFSVVSQIALAVLAAAVVTFALSRPRWPWRVAGAGALALCTFFGFSWPLALALQRPPPDCLPPALPEADRSAVDYLRARIAAGESVFRSEHADAYAVYGGLPQQTVDWGVASFGFGDSLHDRRRRLLANPGDLDELLRQGFRWLVLGPPDGVRLRVADGWVREGRADLAVEFPPLRVYRLRPSSP